MADNNVTLEEQIVIQANEAIKSIDKLKQSVKGLKTETSNAGSAIKTGLTFASIYKGGRKLLSFLSSANDDAMDLIETTNLFEVSMGKGIDGLNKYYEKAIKFQNQLTEALGTNINESMNFQALFNSMGTSMGLDKAVAYKISENFTKLGYDLASLYNTSTDKAMQKLQSGLSGSSTRPLRSFGIDITQNTLGNTLADLGISKSIAKLNQAEKMVLRYIAVLRQSSIAHGDFARTLESPANQLRIFQAQLLAFRQNIGGLWQGLLRQWMPYINGILMAINALIKAIGSLFGIKFGATTSAISSSLASGASGASGIADGLDKAGGSAKKLKEELDLMPWDEIHNIDLGNDSSSSSGGGGVSGGGGGMSIDQGLLDAMGEYDNMMDKVRNKATDIRDRIMEWLGFTKRINPFTNEISWDYTGMSKSAKMVVTALKAIVAIGIVGKLVKFLGYLGTLKGVLAGTIAPATGFQSILALIGSSFKNIGIVGSLAIETFKGVYAVTEGTKLTKFSTALSTTAKGVWDLIPAVAKLAGGLVGLVASTITTYKAMKDLSLGNAEATSSYIKLGVGMAGAVASGALLGSVIPGVGTAVGAVAGGVIGLTGALIGWQSETDKLIAKSKENREENEKYLESIRSQREAIQENVNSQLAYVGYVEDLVKELDTLVDAEGNVKAGMEGRANFILNQLNDAMGTEYKLIDGTIEGYEELASSIDDVIEKKKAEIILNANQQAYADAISRQVELQKKRNEAQQIYNEKNQKLKDLYQQIVDVQTGGTLLDHAYAIKLMNDYNRVAEEVGEAKIVLEGLATEIVEDNVTIMNYEDLMTATIEGDTDKIEEARQRFVNATENANEKASTSILAQITKEIDYYETLKTRRGEIDDEKYEHMAKTEEASLDKLAETLIGMTTLENANEPDIVEGWRRIANFSEEKYDEYISKLPIETQTAIDNAITKLNGNQPRARRAGGDLSNATINGAKAEANNNSNGIPSVVRGIIDGLVNGLMYATGPWGTLWNVGRHLISAVMGGAKHEGDIQSPSKEMYKIGDFLDQGLANGIVENGGLAVTAMKKAMQNTLEEADKFANGVNVNPSEYSIDTNKFINYGSVSGNISSQIDITNSISDRVYRAVMDGLQNSTINVGIEAKTEEGILLKRVQSQAREYRMQTGKAPFPTM